MWPLQVGNGFVATGHLTELLLSSRTPCSIPVFQNRNLLEDSLTLPFTVCTFDNVPTQTSPGGDKDPYEEWACDDFFKEDGIVLDPQTSLPVAYELISALLPICGKLALLDTETI